MTTRKSAALAPRTPPARSRETILREFIKVMRRRIERTEVSLGVFTSDLRAVFMLALSRSLAFDEPFDVEDVCPRGSLTPDEASRREQSYFSFREMDLSTTSAGFSPAEVRFIYAELLTWLCDDMRRQNLSRI